MDTYLVTRGPFKGHRGEGGYVQILEKYKLYIPSRANPDFEEFFHKSQVRFIKRGVSKAPGAVSAPAPILEKDRDGRLQDAGKNLSIRGFKCACGSVWCPTCFKLKGGAKRVANRLAEMNYKAVRQVVLTVDLKKFNESGQQAFEELREKKAIAQFIHNLKRTAGKKIKDHEWVLEWHEDGAPHWHLFVETERGRKGMIGNESLLKYWPYGLVFESFVKSRKHWARFTDYFAANGYFDPNRGPEVKDKRHQLELPDWAKSVTYRIRKTGSMVKRKKGKSPSNNNNEKGKGDGKGTEKSNTIKPMNETKTYREILAACGKATWCHICTSFNKKWERIKIPYKEFIKYPGEYIEGGGFIIFMNIAEYCLFIALYDDETEYLAKCISAS